MLTDVQLEVVNEVFHAHKIILAAASPYFKGIHCLLVFICDSFIDRYSSAAMFTSGLREKDASVIKLQGICSTVMGKLLTFIYTGEIVINQLVVCQLLPAACMLQVNLGKASLHQVYLTDFHCNSGVTCYTGMLCLSRKSIRSQ